MHRKHYSTSLVTFLCSWLIPIRIEIGPLLESCFVNRDRNLHFYNHCSTESDDHDQFFERMGRNKNHLT